MRRALVVLIAFKRGIGHKHPQLDAGLANYCRLLEAIGQNPDQIGQHIQELVAPGDPEGS